MTTSVIHIPRGMEAAIARNATLAAGIGALGGTLVALGAAEIFSRLAIGIYDAYQKYVSLNAAAETYEETVAKQRDADFTNTRSIEDTRDRIQEANRAATEFKNLGQEIQNGAWKDILQGALSGNVSQLSAGAGNLIAGRQLGDAGYKSQGQSDALNQTRIQQDHEENLALIQRAHAGDAALQGEQKITAELQKQLAVNGEQKRFSRSRTRPCNSRASEPAATSRRR